jgi:hypothetical protein
MKGARVVIGACTVAGLLLAAPAANAQLCGQIGSVSTATPTLSENFNTLATSGGSNVLPNSFEFAYVESGSSPNLTYAASDGSSATANTYSYGTGTTSERALGELTDTTVSSTIGACFTNNTPSPFNSFRVGYTGEEWRLGTVDANIDRLDFQYSLDAFSITDPGATWVDVNPLDFSIPNNIGSGAKDGNNAANRTVIAPVPILRPISAGGTWYIRWLPTDVTASDDGLGIDDFTLTGVNSDVDADGIADYADNCAQDANPTQSDADNDGAGDACDPTDMDSDGVPDSSDNCPKVANPNQANGDGDGAGDACDPLPAVATTVPGGKQCKKKPKRRAAAAKKKCKRKKRK